MPIESSSAADVAVMAVATEDAPTPAQANGFATLGLVSPLLAAVAELGYTQPTAVQAQAVPAALAGGDWMVSSQTGSGKTAAFLLPVLQRLLSAPAIAEGKVSSPRAVVLCPTRELAQQVADDAIGLMRGVVMALKTTGKHDAFKQSARGLRVATVVGGVPYGKQIFDLRGASLLVATPGRLLDLHERGQIRLDQAQTLVVDEADRMLDLGFADDLAAIHELTSSREQTMMYSATFAPRIMALAARVMRDPQRLALASAQDRHADITQTLHWADNLAHKEKLLDHWLRDAGLDQAVVFASTQADTETIADALQQKGHAAVALHGAMPQSVRNRRLQNLRDGRVRVLVATDVAARGIDVPTISHVINFGLPMKAEDYVHRIGRTGRAGRSGTAVTIAEHRERHKIRQIEQYTNQPITASEIAGLEPQIRPQPRPAGGGPRRGGPGGNRGGFRGNGGGYGGHGGGNGGFGGPRGGGDNRFAPRDGGERFAPRDNGGERYAQPQHAQGDRFAPRHGDRFAPRDGGERFNQRDGGDRFAPRDGGFRQGHGGQGQGGPRRDATSGFAKAPRTAPRKSGFGSR